MFRSRSNSMLSSTRSVLSDQSANGSLGSSTGGGASGARPKGHPQWKQKFDAPGFCVPQRSHGFSLALLALPALAQNDGDSISLGVGEQRSLPLQNVARVAIGDPRPYVREYTSG